MTDAAEEQVWRRLHPLTPVLKGGLVFVIVVGVLVANLRDHFIGLLFPLFFDDFDDLENMRPNDGSSEDAGELIADFEFDGDFLGLLLRKGLVFVFLLVVIGVVLLVLALTWMSWRYHTFRITGEAVEVRKGVLFRTHRRAPLERIQSVNLQRPLLARMLGLTKIDVQTAGQSGNVELSYLGHVEAKRVRDEILVSAKRALVPDVGGSAENPIEAHLNVIADEDILIGTDSMLGAAALRVPVGRLIAATFLGHEAVALYLVTLGVMLSSIFFGPAAFAVLIPGIIALVSVAFSRFNRGFRFTISGSEDAVRTGSGLTATSTETIPLRRIHAVDIMQPLWWRPFGWWRVRVTTAGGQPGNNSNNQNMFQNVLLPVGTKTEVDELLRMLKVVGAEAEAEAAVRAPRNAWPVLMFARSALRVELVTEPVSRDTQMRISRGFFTRHTVLMPLQRAQSVEIARPLVHYALGLARLQVHTVMGPVQVTARGLQLEEAQRVFEETARAIVEAQKADRR